MLLILSEKSGKASGEVSNTDPERALEFHHQSIGGKGAEAQKKSMS